MQEPEFGKIPHRPFRHVPMHIIYRLKGSLTTKQIAALSEQRRAIRNRIRQHLLSYPELDRRIAQQHLIAEGEKDFEEIYDDELHHTNYGPFYLKQPALAKIVIDSWLWVAENRGILVYAICVMGNHVHVLAQSRDGQDTDAGPILKATKGFSAKGCNKLIDRTGKAFWEKNYFDRDVRSGQFTRVMWYILNNPVQAKLAEHWEDWPGTYLNPDYDDLFRQ